MTDSGPLFGFGGNGVDGADTGDDAEEVGVVAVTSGAEAVEPDDTLKIPDHLPVLPIRDAVAFPGTVMPLQVEREKPKRVLDLALAGNRMVAVVAQRSPTTEDPKLEDLYRVGTACTILKMFKLSDGSETIIVHGLRRVGLEALTKEDEYLVATVHAHQDQAEITTEQRALVHTIRTAADRIIELSPNVPDEARKVLHGIEKPGGLADFLAANLPLGVAYKQEILETFDVTERLRKVNLAVAAQLEVVELSSKIQKQVHDSVDKTQREYYLREQMKAIQHELGQDQGEGPKIVELKKRIDAAKMPETVQAEALREVERLEAIPTVSPEYSMTLDYIEWLIELPWSAGTEDNLDIKRAEEVLNEDHYGLDKVKKRILEFLAVRKLKKDTHGPILCFTGPPGVGKTSLGQSIARAMGRKFIRISLGGIRDEATIRGHRRTYIGAMPGRIVREIRRAGSNNPLFMLDEVDKIGQDVRGDPMSALLEVLDPAQNATFSDHYLAVPFDLSKVLFIGTANYMSAIEPALRDRMEIIEIPGYTHQEKLMIARRHLLPRQLNENGLSAEQLRLSDEIIQTIIGDYTREAGVRSLERRIGSVCRARAAAVVRGDIVSPDVTVDDLRAVLGPAEFESEIAATSMVPGVVTGLAFTPAGGEILFIEANKMPGRGQLMLTGQLGEVMRESAQAAASIIRSRTGRWTIKPEDFAKADLHVHVPAGAIPKDGPSAGVAMLAAMSSVLLGKPVDPTIGMTGEITLSGRVLPVGGIREKVLAAHRAGLKTIILPARNASNVDEIPPEIRAQLNFVYVTTIDEVLDTIFAQIKKIGRGKRTVGKAVAKHRSSTAAKRRCPRSSAHPKARALAKKRAKRWRGPASASASAGKAASIGKHATRRKARRLSQAASPRR